MGAGNLRRNSTKTPSPWRRGDGLARAPSTGTPRRCYSTASPLPAYDALASFDKPSGGQRADRGEVAGRGAGAPRPHRGAPRSRQTVAAHRPG